MITKYDFMKLDAFASKTSTGNPAGAIILNSFNEITEQQMQQIAYELKGFVSEVAYIAPSESTDFKLRYYSSEKEVAFCGHATIALMYNMIAYHADLTSKSEITIETLKGVSTIYNNISESNAVFVEAPEPVFRNDVLDKNEIAQAYGIDPSIIDDSLSIEVVNGGLHTLLLPLKLSKNVTDLSPSSNRLKAFLEKYDIDVTAVFSLDTVYSSSKCRVRVFCPGFGYLEDPATGSGNAALGYYMNKHGLWDGTTVTIEQGPSVENPNYIKLKLENGRVLFGGSSICKIKGTYTV